MDRRIFGLENEYGVTCTFRGQRRLSPDEVARYLFRRVVSWGRSSNVFLENGARLYLDVGSHPEYATPECDSVTELITHDKAGERILESLLAAAEARLHEEGIAGKIFLFKNNTDSAGNSYGCHENYLVSRYGEFQRLADVLIPFFVSRQILCGAGKVLATPRGAVYCIAQRAEHIWEGVSSATTRSRPIINTRDEPHADAERYRRLHVIVGDSNMSEWSAFLKVGATDLVLAMVEEATVLRDLTLENPIRAIREISHDMSCRRKVRLANGREASALEIQREYFEKAARFVDRRDAGETAKRVVDMWGHVLDALEHQELDRIGRQVDWVTKYLMIERARARHNLPLSPPQGRPHGPDLPRRQPQARPLLPAGAQRLGRAGLRRPGHRPGHPGAPPDHPGPAPGRVHPPGQGAPPRLHRRLGPPQAQRPGPADRPVQGPVPRPRRPGRQAHRQSCRRPVRRSRPGRGGGTRPARRRPAPRPRPPARPPAWP